MRVGVAVNMMPNLLKDIILRILARQPDSVMVEIEENEESKLVAAIKHHKLDVLVTTRAKGEPSEAPLNLLYACPDLSVLNLESGGQEGTMYLLRPEAIRLPGVSPAELATAIQSVKNSVDEG